VQSELHRQKAERIERSLALCEASDYEAIIEGALLAAGHWFNLALHDMGFYPPGKDVMHLTKMPVEDFMRVQAAAFYLVGAYDEMEELRSPWVRGGEPGGAQAGARALELLDHIRKAATTVGPHGIGLPGNWNALIASR
jgi:hypothetical protein